MDFLNLLDEYKDDMIKTLQELIAIPSVKGERMENAPFGEAVDLAHQFMLKMAEKDGFDTFNADHFGGHIEFGGYEYDENGEAVSRSDEIMGILVHLDVVPEGSGWDFPPFSGEIHDGRLYGRGAIDDKGPAIAAYYGMKALKDSGIMPKKRVRLILGLDEETGWEGMRYYLKKTQAPDFGFAPDAEFPVIHGEKGIMVFELAKKFGKTAAKGLILRKIEGGSAPNMVPDFAKALIRGDGYEEIKDKLNEFREATGYKLHAKGRGKSLEISAEGVSAHGSTPEKGVNAISVLMEFLGKLSFNSEDTSEFIEFYNEKIGYDYYGENIGCGLYDDISGKLAFNPGMIYMDEEAVRITVNVRYPLTLDEEQVYSGMLPVITPLNMGIIKIEHKAPIYIPKDHSLIKTLMEVYQDHTGDIESEPMIIGGGTYARAAKNIVAYGMNFPGEPEVQHQKNEYILLETFMKGAKIYADAIYKLACLD